MYDAQRDVEKFMLAHGLSHDPAIHTLDLVSEIGELAKLLLQASGYGRETSNYDDEDISDELGDTLYSLLALATVLGVDAEHALARALRKYDRRIREGGGPGSR